MVAMPRLALMTPPDGPEPAPASLAILAGLAESKWKVQHFRSWARPTGSKLVGQVTGLPGRHLDRWLMPPDLCRAIFARGARGTDLAVVEGTQEEPMPRPVRCGAPAHFDSPGPLGPIADALDLPRVAVVDCRGWKCRHLPWIPPEADAILLDGLERPEDFRNARSMISLLTGKPLIGAVEALPQIRAALADIPAEMPVPKELTAALGQSFLRFADLDAIRALAESRPFPSGGEESDGMLPPALCPGDHRRFRVAFAMDEAFGAYFPDTLETLEALGADLIEFSPLRDGSLPEGVDLVMIGCGCPDRYADQLAANHSLISELRAHVCRGNRIYSEGGGTAYLARTMRLLDREVNGAGILPITAELQRDPTDPTPVERTLVRDVWLGPKGTSVRGYRSGRWVLHPAPEPDDCPSAPGPLTDLRDMYYRKNAVGSLIHLHLGALPVVVAAFASASRRPPIARPGRSR
jgi:cobyrinic acid a,c-diamide synthase